MVSEQNAHLLTSIATSGFGKRKASLIIGRTSGIPLLRLFAKVICHHRVFLKLFILDFYLTFPPFLAAVSEASYPRRTS